MLPRKNALALASALVLLAACSTTPSPNASQSALVNSPSPSSMPSESACPSSSPLALASPTDSPSPSPSAQSSPTAKPTAKPAPSYPPAPLPGVGSQAPLVSHGSRAHPMIAITIDDDFSQSAVLADLATLEANHINATFFPIGHVVASNPSLWQKVAKAGFPIANHTYDHVILTKHTLAYITADIEKDNAVVSKIIGEPLVPFIRPPGGAWNGDVLTAAAAAGERAVVLWDLTDGDTAPLPGRANISLLIKNAEKGIYGSILLMHANLPYAQQALPAEIAYYRAKGYEFVTLGQMFGVPGPVPFPPGHSYPPAPLPSPKPVHSPSPTPSPSARPTTEPSLEPSPSPTPDC